ncbi:MAG: L,D-transpeptidase family protein [Nocardioidaceae bacterium]
MKKIVGVIGAGIVTLGMLSGAPALAQPGQPPAQAMSIKTKPKTPYMNQRFARERTVYGARDASPYAIAHVTELQYRLRWAREYTGPITGYFGRQTQIAVRRYQRHEGLLNTGNANHVTWKHLIQDTVRGQHRFPKVCRAAGWHACYDRTLHQVTLFRAGVIRNSWLVRGGDYSMQTRKGTFGVFLRDIDHVSTLYDASPMPYSQFFSGGEALHGSRFMMDPFVGHSHGCVNMYVEDARQLWNLTSTKPLRVTVYGAWS